MYLECNTNISLLTAPLVAPPGFLHAWFSQEEKNWSSNKGELSYKFYNRKTGQPVLIGFVSKNLDSGDELMWPDVEYLGLVRDNTFFSLDYPSERLLRTSTNLTHKNRSRGAASASRFRSNKMWSSSHNRHPRHNGR